MIVIIIEDEAILSNALKEELLELDGTIEIVAQLGSIKETLAYFAQNEAPDLFFSDIELADGLSFEIFKAIENIAPIIFCTAYNQYALEAFQVYGIDYILKPFDTKSISEALQKYKTLFQNQPNSAVDFSAVLQLFEQQKQRQKNSLLIHRGDKITPLSIHEIALASLQNGVVYVHTYQNTRYAVNYNLDRLHTIFGEDFYRVNRQYLIHRKAVQHASQYFARKLTIRPIIKFEDPLIVSKANASDFLRWLEG